MKHSNLYLKSVKYNQICGNIIYNSYAGSYKRIVDVYNVDMRFGVIVGEKGFYEGNYIKPVRINDFFNDDYEPGCLVDRKLIKFFIVYTHYNYFDYALKSNVIELNLEYFND